MPREGLVRREGRGLAVLSRPENSSSQLAAQVQMGEWRRIAAAAQCHLAQALSQHPECGKREAPAEITKSLSAFMQESLVCAATKLGGLRV